MKNLKILPLLLVTTFAFAAEDWKGTVDQSQLDFGGMVGLGNMGGATGFGVVGTVSKKIINQGFVPDMNNSASVEIQIGPVFLPTHTPFFYSGLLRWDFKKDENIGFYAIGGIGGFTAGSAFGTSATIFPRFGVGVMWDVFKGPILVRGELSHELIAVGIVVPLFY
jgi:hypothetical protein